MGLVVRDRVFLGGSVFDAFRLAGGSTTSGWRWGVAFDRKDDNSGEEPSAICNGSGGSIWEKIYQSISVSRNQRRWIGWLSTGRGESVGATPVKDRSSLIQLRETW